MISAHIDSHLHTGIKFHFPYPTGIHTDNACDWDANDKHSTEVLKQDTQSAVLKRTLDSTVYYVELKWEGKALLKRKREKIISYCFHKKMLFRFHVLLPLMSQISLLYSLIFLKLKSLAKNHWVNFLGRRCCSRFLSLHGSAC